MAILRGNLRMLEHILDLPEGVRITDIRWSDDADDVMHFYLEGPDLGPGFVEAAYTEDENGAIHLLELRTVS
jgi:hypothetical protein